MPRHLPVVPPDESDDALAASRPVWHWVLIGMGFTLTLFAPLALLVARVGPLGTIAMFVVASGASGALVGRFGGATLPRHVALSAVLAALAAVTTLLLLPAPPALFVAAFGALAVPGALAGAGGARFGLSKRPGKMPAPTAKPRK